MNKNIFIYGLNNYLTNINIITHIYKLKDGYYLYMYKMMVIIYIYKHIYIY